MKLTSTSSLSVLATLALTAQTARADDALGAGFVVVVEAAPLAMGVADLAGHQGSKAYGTAEILFGGGAAALNLGVLALISSEGGEPSGAAVALFGGAAAIDAALMVHGIYVVTRPDKPSPLTVTAGSARGRIAPTVVSDGKSTAPALGIGGTF